jgi:hypothetical protein
MHGEKENLNLSAYLCDSSAYFVFPARECTQFTQDTPFVNTASCDTLYSRAECATITQILKIYGKE